MTGKLIDSPWPFPEVYDLEMTGMVPSEWNRVACPSWGDSAGRGWSASQRQASVSILTLHLLACPCKTTCLYPDISTFRSCQHRDGPDMQCDIVKHENESAHTWIYSLLKSSLAPSEAVYRLSGHFSQKLLLLRLCLPAPCEGIPRRFDLGMSKT